MPPADLSVPKATILPGAAQVIMPHVLGTIEVYEQQTSWEVILENSDIVVLWSANPITTLADRLDLYRSGRLGIFQKIKRKWQTDYL